LAALKAKALVAPAATGKRFHSIDRSRTKIADGYHGRVGIHEVLEVSSTIKEMILKNSSADDIEKMAKKEGMMTMIEDGIFLVASGVTSTEEVCVWSLSSIAFIRLTRCDLQNQMKFEYKEQNKEGTLMKE